MSKKIKDIAIKILREELERSRYSKEIDVYITYKNAISFSKNMLFNEAKEFIGLGLKKTKHEGQIYFLEAINSYFSNLASKGGVGYENSYKRDLKEYIKPIKRAISHIEDNFDSQTLLFYRREGSKKIFYTIDNAVLLSFFDEITQILNHFGYNKEADKIFMLKGKIELGFMRYLFYQKEKILLSYFDEDTNYEIASEREIAKILSYYIVDESYFKNNFERYKKERLKEFGESEEMLEILFNLKRIDKKSFSENLKIISKSIEKMPERILKKSDYEKELIIRKSIDRDYKDEAFEVKGENKVLVNIKSPKIANFVLRVL